MEGAHKNIQHPYIFPYAEGPDHQGKNTATQEDGRRQEIGGREGRRTGGDAPSQQPKEGGRKKPTRDHESIDCSVFAISSLSGPGNGSPVTFGIMR